MKTKERIKETGEVFTPMELCLQLVRDLPEETLKDPEATFLDNSCGNGNFLVALLQVLTEEYGHSHESTLNRIYGVDRMQDNIEEAWRRLGGGHLVCADALTYDYSFSVNDCYTGVR